MSTAIEPQQLAEHWLAGFATACESGDADDFAALFVEDGYWKDFLSLTGAYRTYAVQDAAPVWSKQVQFAQPSRPQLASGRMAPRRVRRAARNLVEAYFDFETAQGRGTGFVRILDDPSAPTPRAWILLTTLQELRGHEEKIGSRRPTGVEYSQSFQGDNWLDERVKERRFDDREPEVLIIGGGQGGLVLGARLRAMGVDALIVEENERIGDNWRQRYHSLTLHNEVWTNNLPYMPYPETWPVFVPKDMLAGWLESYADAMALNIWTSTRMTHSEYDETAQRWTVTLERDGFSRTVHPKELVLAIGGSTGAPFMPSFPGLEDYSGELIHSSTFSGGVSYEGKHAVVIGTGTSAHDVAQELSENGAVVTMVQRDAVAVVSLVPSGTMVYSIYSEGPPDDMDLAVAATPYPVLVESYQFLTKKTCEIDKELLDRLREVGFKLDFGHDGTGFHMMYLRSGGGYYINVGCSDLIADGKISLLQFDDIDTFVPRGIRKTDGTVIPADIVVMGTGYRNLQTAIAPLLGDAVAERVGRVWGFDENYIMKNMWQPTAQPGLWLMGGTLSDARLYSKFLAVQLVAAVKDVPFPTPPPTVPFPETKSLAAST